MAADPPVARVDISSLSLEEDLGRGGQGRVVAVSGFVIRGRWPAAAKVYAAEHLGSLNGAVLERMVGLPRQLGSDDSDWLLDHAAWPAVVVEDEGGVCGFLMRTVPGDFRIDFHTRSLGSQRKLAEIAYLLNSDRYATGAGIIVRDWQRLLLLKRLAKLLSRLHAIGVVVGDLSPKNLLYTLKPGTDCFIIDCDAAQLHGETVLQQVETPDWEAPAGETRATTATDAYKFGLLAIRLFARDQASRDAGALTSVSADLGRLAVLSQQADPQARPEPAEWIGALERAADRAGKQVPAAPPATASRQSSPAAAAQSMTVPAPMVGAAFRAPAVSPARRPVRRTRPALLALGAALLALVIVIGVLRSHTPSKVSGGSGGTPFRATAHVDVASGVAGDPRATAVARMLGQYFSGVNSHAGGRHDTKMALVSLGPDNGGRARTAEVTFQTRSEQICTDWDVTYKLATSRSGQYKISAITKSRHSGCWTTYLDSSGFSVSLPPGWTVSSTSRSGLYPGVHFTGPDPGFDLFVSWSRKTGPSALGAWQQLNADYALAYPTTYQLTDLRNVYYRGYDAAVWEFTNTDKGGALIHVIDWGFVVIPGPLRSRLAAL